MRSTLLALVLSITALSGAHADTLYVSDQFEVTLRSGESTGHSIVRMLPSGTSLEVLGINEETGYTHVRTSGGTEGFVLSRFLMGEPASRDQLSQLRSRLAASNSEEGGLRRQVDELVQQVAEASNTIDGLSNDNAALTDELESIKRVSENAIRLDQSNRDLTGKLAESEARIQSLVMENDRLRSQTTRKWFLTGAGVVLFSMLFGITLTRIRWRKRSSWSDF